MTIITLSGKAASGKDTAGDVLVKRYGFTKIALADPLRDICSRVFNLPMSMFLDRDKKDTRMQRIHLDFHDIDKIRKIVENEWGYTISEEARNQMEEHHGAEFDTPRDVLRYVGTHILRNCLSENIWIELAMQKIQESKGKIVITDCRFENEREAFRKLGAVLCLVKRNDNGENIEHEFSLGQESDYDVVFNNDGTLHAYESTIDMWYNAKQAEFQYYRVWKYV